MKYQIKQMLLQGGGAIVNIASSSGHVGFPGAALYTASKHAVVGMTRAAGLEYVKLGIRLNAISPGVVATQMMRRYLATVDRKRGGAGKSVSVRVDLGGRDYIKKKKRDKKEVKN